MPISALMVGVSAAGGLGGAAIQSNAAGNAASAQQAAAEKVTQQAQQAATTATGDVSTATTSGNQTINAGLQAQLAALAPYISAGNTTLTGLQSDLASLTAPGNAFTFNPETSPQLQFEQQQANQALLRNAAANGTLTGGGTVRASDIMNTGLASEYMNQAFQQALDTYNTNRQNVLSQIQGLTNITGLGFNATGAENQDIGNAAQTTAANTIGSGTYAGNAQLTAAQIAEQATAGAANAQSASDIASGKAWGNALNTIGNAGLTYGLMRAPNSSSGVSSGVNGGNLGPTAVSDSISQIPSYASLGLV